MFNGSRNVHGSPQKDASNSPAAAPWHTLKTAATLSFSGQFHPCNYTARAAALPLALPLALADGLTVTEAPALAV